MFPGGFGHSHVSQMLPLIAHPAPGTTTLWQAIKNVNTTAVFIAHGIGRTEMRPKVLRIIICIWSTPVGRIPSLLAYIRIFTSMIGMLVYVSRSVTRALITFLFFMLFSPKCRR